MAILVTGAAGFIGMHVAQQLLDRGEAVVGVDNLNDYYDPSLKQARLGRLQDRSGFTFHRLDISDREAMFALVDARPEIDRVIHLAAQAGVRHSLTDPYVYVQSNVMGHLVVMEACRRLPGFRHLVYASSSSVYGGNTDLPFSVDQRVDNPVSLYAATKRADELMSDCYAHLYDLPQTGLRFFTVYGPWGRPDMSAWIFVDAILNDRPITLFNHGRMRRDFTFIDDIVAGVIAALDRPPAPRADGRRHRVYNLGNHRSEELMSFVRTIEEACGKEAIKRFDEMQPGDVPATYADIAASQADLGFQPTTPISQGVPAFVDWFRGYNAR
ncbi:MAG: NAD-dependent epimerase/dehydratase family protein [Alphaproteobacteria bacterium]|jgi:UDP-glucuronate 4-epimerase|nr:NAD-dependent epimerase/dehydratase family protein [Alphaproteobacteria bacterium]